MGLRAWLRAVRSEPDVVWVPGRFKVTSASRPAFGSRGSSGWWTGVLSGEGIDPTPLTHHGIAPTATWPQPGQTIAVTFVPSDLTLIEFNWTSSPSAEAIGLDEARKLAEDMKHHPDADGS